MPSVVVCGGSMIGSLTARLLAGDGHDVVVLERDPAPPPADARRAFAAWDRPGVAQFRQPHNLFPRFRAIADAELPGLTGALVDAGCRWVDLAAGAGAGADAGRFRYVTGRRPVVEAVVAGAAADHPGVTVRRGVGAAGLVAGRAAAGVPHVAGVRTSAGDCLRADLVVDAMGRRSPLARWLEEAGAAPPAVTSEDCGFAYYTRYFRGPELPATLGPPVQHLGTFTLLTLVGDGDTWSVTLWAQAADPVMRAVRDPERFDRVVAACPLGAHWLAGEATSGVLPMAGILDRSRRFMVGGRPVATGVAAVGDAWACTNPSAGRGLTVGLIHAQRLRGVVRACLGEPERLARCWDEVTEAEVAPFVWHQIAADRARIAEMDALRRGEEPPPPADPAMTALGNAAYEGGDAFRGLLDIVTCLAQPEEVLARPAIRAQIAAADGTTPIALPGPTRAELVDLLG